MPAAYSSNATLCVSVFMLQGTSTNAFCCGLLLPTRRTAKVRRMIDNPMGFEDFRALKAAGKVVHNHPDFKSLGGSCAVWVDDVATLPDDLRTGLTQLPVDMPVGSPEARYKRKWEALLADPTAYEDLRAYKAAMPARSSLPDFRVASSAARDQALWLDATNEDTAAYLERLDMCAMHPVIVAPDA